ncbi:MAG TPA: hypothetical protein VK671_02710 [Mucilaginibacter sp.]|jgi:hypothetical protein|nr:hypothetical protein [Mucilaginibacter sp.]
MKTDDTSHTIAMFLKFGSRENITDLFDNGTIYLNPLQYFRGVEDTELRGDRYEGVSQIKNYPPGSFEIPAINFKGKYINIHLKNAVAQVLGNIYSLYCISSFAIPNPIEFSIDQRVNGFGSHCLMVNDNVEFLNRIEKALQKMNLKFCHGFVTYYDRYAINGEVTFFQKPQEFAYQNEFRIYVKSNTTRPLVLKIGNLKNIAQIIPTSEVITLKLVSDKKESA